MKLINQQIVLPDKYSLSQEAVDYVSGLILESKGIELPKPPPPRAQCLEIQQHAVVMGREMRKHVAEVEATHKQLKEPILIAGRLLDTLKNNHLATVLEEIARLEEIANDVQKEEQKRVEEAEEKRRQEIARLDAERIAAVQAAQAASAAATGAPRVCTESMDGQHHFSPDLRLDPTGETATCEYCGTPAGHGDPEELGEAQALADIAAEQARNVAEAAEQKLRETIVAPLPAPVKVKGMAVRQELRWEVTDINALYAARPELCNPPTPKAMAIKSTCTPEMPVPGLKLWWEDKTTFRK